MNPYGEITFKRIERLKMARYVVISPNPEDDVNEILDRWAEKSGLLNHPGYTPKKIGWDFPYVSKEQQEQFGLRGYVAAYVIPEDFAPACPGAELAYLEADDYAVITVFDPMTDPFDRIPGGYRKIFEHINPNGLAAKSYENRIAFEEVYEKDGVTCMDIFVPVDR